jgi:UPF0288 family protein (methanogenesis marker protein 3)
MPLTDEQVLSTLHRLKDLSWVHEDGFICFTQMTIETSGLDPEAAEQWLLANGGHLKHVRVPSIVNQGRKLQQPDMEPCYFVPDALLA